MFLHLVPKIPHPMGNLCTLDSVSVPETVATPDW